MKNPALTWSFPFEHGTALPKDRDIHPSEFDIPHGHQSLYPVVDAGRQLYLSITLQGEPQYFLSPRSGSPVNLDRERSEKQLLAGLLEGLPPRINSITFFSRVMALPEYLHEAAISSLEHRRIDTIHESTADLVTALRSMNSTMGAAVQRAMSISKMAREVSLAPAEERVRLWKGFRKEHSEAWIEDARPVAERMIQRAAQKLHETPPTAEYEFKF